MTVLSLANCVLTPKLLLDRLTWNILNFLLKKKGGEGEEKGEKEKEGKVKREDARRERETTGELKGSPPGSQDMIRRVCLFGLYFIQGYKKAKKRASAQPNSCLASFSNVEHLSRDLHRLLVHTLRRAGVAAGEAV